MIFERPIHTGSDLTATDESQQGPHNQTLKKLSAILILS